MTRLFNRQIEKEKRRFLRNNMTKAEELLWSEIRAKKIYGQRFLRQFSVGSYVLDFYCPKLKIAIEIDGASHDSKQGIEYDAYRENEISLANINFIRFKNEEVFSDIKSVINKIKLYVKQKL